MYKYIMVIYLSKLTVIHIGHCILRIDTDKMEYRYFFIIGVKKS